MYAEFMKMAEKNNPFFAEYSKMVAEFDPTKMMDEFAKMTKTFEVSKIDFDTYLDLQKKNFEALTAANQVAVEGAQALAKRQAEMLQQGLEEVSKMIEKFSKIDNPQGVAAAQADVLKASFLKSIDNTRELAELVAKSNTEASDAINVERVCLTGNATGTDTEIYACPEAAVQLVAGGLDVTEYTWSPSNAVSDATLQAPMYTGVVSNTLSVTYTNQCGLEITDEVHVVVDEVTVELASDGNALNCTNDQTLTCAAESDFGAYLDYAWYVNNALVSNDMTFAATAPGHVTLEVTYPGTESLLCKDEQDLQVVVDTATFDVSAGLPGTVTCSNPAIELLGTTANDPNALAQWTTEDGAIDGDSDVVTAYAAAGGTYVLTVTNAENGCTSFDSVVIDEDMEMPEVTLGYVDGTLDCNVSQVSMVGLEVFPQEYTPMYTWMSAETGEVISTQSEATFTEAGAYTLQVEFLENGCTTTTKQAAEVHSNAEVLDLSELVLPNVITPDNNGSNDRFLPFVPGHEDTNVLTMMDEYHIQVFNRWGTLLFENNGQPLQWDGRASGTLVDPGSYIVSVQYLATCGGEQSGQLRTTLEVIR